MPTLVESSTTLEDKVRELCHFILEDPQFSESRSKIDAFLKDDAAQQAYRAWQEKGQELHRKSHEGITPTDSEMAVLEQRREEVMANPVASEFVAAEEALNQTFGTVTKMVQKTLQWGRVPTEEDLAESGCCGGGGGCGCH